MKVNEVSTEDSDRFADPIICSSAVGPLSPINPLRSSAAKCDFELLPLAIEWIPIDKNPLIDVTLVASKWQPKTQPTVLDDR